MVENRKKFVGEYQALCSKATQSTAKRDTTPPPQTPPDLHMFIVTPSPEREQMVPRTSDTIRTLGVADSTPNQDAKIDRHIKHHKREEQKYQRAYARYEKELERHEKTYPNPHGGIDLVEVLNKAMPGINEKPKPPKKPEPITILSDALEARKNAASVDGVGIKTLVVNLWTQDRNFKGRLWQEPLLSDRDAKKITDLEGDEREAKRKEILSEKVAPRYREIYIHSKLMILDDAMFTVGSANLNWRSMHGDEEINVASDDAPTAKDLRKTVFELHSTANRQDWDKIPKMSTKEPINRNALLGDSAITNPDASEELSATANAHENWQLLSRKNLKNKDKGLPIAGYIVKFRDKRSTIVRLA